MVELCGLWRMIRSNGKHLLRCAQICHTNTLFFLGFLLSFRQSTFFHLPSFSARLLSRCFAIALSDSRLPSLSKLHLANILFLFFFFVVSLASAHKKKRYVVYVWHARQLRIRKRTILVLQRQTRTNRHTSKNRATTTTTKKEIIFSSLVNRSIFKARLFLFSFRFFFFMLLKKKKTLSPLFTRGRLFGSALRPFFLPSPSFAWVRADSHLRNLSRL